MVSAGGRIVGRILDEVEPESCRRSPRPGTLHGAEGAFVRDAGLSVIVRAFPFPKRSDSRNPESMPRLRLPRATANEGGSGCLLRGRCVRAGTLASCRIERYQNVRPLGFTWPVATLGLDDPGKTLGA